MDKTIARRRARTGLVFTAPFTFGFILFFIQPLIFTIVYSLCSVDITAIDGIGLKFIKLRNYSETLTGAEFIPAMSQALIQLVSSVPVILVMSMFVAVMLNQKFKGRTIARATFFLPVVVSSGVIIKILREDVFNQSIQMGTAQSSYLFQGVGMQDILIGMSLPNWVIMFFMSIINGIFDVLWKSGVQIIVFLAAMQSVPSQLYEAAHIEGATGWECFWKVTFPMVSPMIVVNLVYSVIDSFTDYQNPIMIMINRVGFQNYMYDSACAIAVMYALVMLVIIGVTTTVVNLFTRRIS